MPRASLGTVQLQHGVPNPSASETPKACGVSVETFVHCSVPTKHAAHAAWTAHADGTDASDLATSDGPGKTSSSSRFAYTVGRSI